MQDKFINNIKNIVWWIPFKKLRNSIRDILTYLLNNSTLLENELTSMRNELNTTKENLNFLIDVTKKLYSNKNIIYPIKLSDMQFYFYDSIFSKTVSIVEKEINFSNSYNFNSIDFKEGDIVIDIGGNIGMVSIYLAKKYPFLKIYAFEPIKQNYENFLKNIEINNIDKNIITVENVAISGDGRDLTFMFPLHNSGGGRIEEKAEWHKIYPLNLEVYFNVHSITFDDIFNKYSIDKCKLLKIDCEGSEYDILYNANKNNLKKCEYMVSEFHDGTDNIKKLYDYCSQYINNIKYEKYFGNTTSD